MQCPVCNVELKIADRQGVEIDYCPKCRGVWLDRGELDKLIERSAQQEVPPASSPPRRERQNEFDPEEYDDDYEYKRKNDDRYQGEDRYPPSGKKKKSFLGNMFDIFD